MIEEIADCFVLALQINKVKMIRNLVKGLVDNSTIFKTEIVEKIIRMVKFKINRTIERIEKGEYGTYRIEYKADRKQNETVPEEKIETAGEKNIDVFGSEETKKLKKAEKEKMKKEKKIYEFIRENSPYYYQARDIQLQTNISSKECTEIVERMITDGRIKISKKGKDRIYGATLETQEKIEEAEVVS